MTESSTATLEREAERRRAEMAETAEQLRAKLTPGQLLDEMTHTFRQGDLGATFGNLKTQVRDNPLALALVGAGVACLFAGAPGVSSRRPAGTASHTGSAHAAGSGVGDFASSAYDSMGDGLTGLGDGASRATSAVGDGLSSGAASVADFARDTSGRARDAVRSMEDDLYGLIDREPLVVGAIGLAIGAAMGALLPETRFEEEHLAGYEDRMVKAGTEAARETLRKAGDVATAASHAAIDEASRQGLVPDNDAADGLNRATERTVDKVAGVLGEPDDTQSKSPTPRV